MTTLELTQQKSGNQSVPILAAFWRSRIKIISAGVERPLTPKEFGQLKLLKQCLGTATSEVLDWAMNNWSQFANKAATKAGIGSSPTTPHIGFLLKHYVVAVEQLQSIANYKKQEEPMAKYNSDKHVESVADPKPFPKTPIKVKFSAEQKVLLMGLDDTGKFEEFLAKVTEKYGEGCIICGGDPEDAVLCEVA